MASAPTTSLSVAREARKFEYELIAERIKPYVVDMTKELPDIEPLISINGSCVCSRGNISAICGEAKGLKQNAALSVLSVLSIRESLLPRVRWCAFRVVIHKFTHSRIHRGWVPLLMV